MLSWRNVKSLTAMTARHFSKAKPFDKILIANRGEIACRVIRTAKKLGVKTVAVYSDADANSMHVRLADEAHWIGSAQSKDSYLRMDRILEVAKKTGSQGIHPGYGFLSENAKFADMVEAAGIAFIGPSSEPMIKMGDKINSKKIAKDAGCFIIPGFEGEVADENEAVRLSREVGYPVMIKASAGGGGKGMRVAYNDDEVREGFRVSKAEALSSFGDDRMLIERFIENPHHIEIQVLADTFGNVVAFPERECSVQRRNQKVVEESPSVYIKPETRLAMQQQAIMLCKATGYRSAGTVEMLADDKQNFYFLEMNTRLQVEHPITELVSGEDLVEHMLWIAAKKPLPKRLTSVQCLPFNGSAIESRVYAEDPLRNFLPSIGPLTVYQEPQLRTPDEESPVTVRIDTGVYEGGVISMYYDPMISKLCTHAPTRAQAISAMEDALDSYVVQGLGNNIPFLRSVFRNKSFIEGDYCTKFIPTEYPTGFHGVQLTADETQRFIASAAAIHLARGELSRVHAGSLNASRTFEPRQPDEEGRQPDQQEFVVVLNGPKGDAYRVNTTIESALSVIITPLDKKGLPIEKDANVIEIADLDWFGDRPLASVGFVDMEGDRSKDRDVDTKVVQFLGVNKSGEGFHLRYLGCDREFIVRTPLEHELSRHMLAPEVRDLSQFLLCPMPGTLVSCDVKEGQKVELGQQLAVVEAMKMQNVLRAPRAGVIKSVKKKAGSNLKVDDIIVEFE